jgi:cell cycle checkpoint control protein RAD9A
MEFSEFSVEEKLHIVISVKDFKAIVTHAGMTATTVSAAYSHPSRPFLLKYSDGGVTSEFVLMTIGDFRGSSTTPAPSAARNAPKISATRQPLQSTESRPGSTAAASMPPPSRHATLSAVRGIPRVAERVRPPPPPPQPSIEADSLFVTDMDDDRQWGPPDFGDDDEPEMVGWDASADNVSSIILTAPHESLTNSV